MKKVLVVGGNGSLGKNIVSKFKNCNKNPWKIVSLDINPCKDADYNVVLDNKFSTDSNILTKISQEFSKNKIEELNAVVCVAGGFDMCSIEKSELVSSLNFLNNVNLYSSVLAAQLAHKYLTSSSLFVLTSALVVHNKEDISSCLSYQLSKYGVENLVSILKSNKSLLPKDTDLIKICPGVIDTEANRENMPDADKSGWTKPDSISTMVKSWADNKDLRPKEGFYLF